MPSNTPLSSITLTSSASSVTFSGIPQTYNDLILVTSTKGTSTSSHCLLTFNSDSGTNYSNTYIYGTGASAMYVGRQTNSTGCFIGRASTTAFGVGTTHIQNYKSSTTYKAVLSKGNIPSEITINYVDLWRNTAPIISLTITGNGGDALVAGSTFDLYGVSTAAANNTQAFGGTEIFYDSSYVYHVFKDSGTFTPNRNLSADILVIAGGGSGGYGGNGGGGGAGGVCYAANYSLTPTTYTVTVGAGGAQIGPTSGSVNGSNSVFGAITANGGGGGGNSATGNNGISGGSGGGGNADVTSTTGGAATQSSGSGFTGYGNAGGTGGNNSSVYSSGGGGGAGGVGGNRVLSPAGIGGAGGVGLNTWSSWASVTGTGVNGYYAGGGGGNGATQGAAGLGGGGTTSTNAVTNTGGGGGGASATNGGSGIVIVRYAR